MSEQNSKLISIKGLIFLLAGSSLLAISVLLAVSLINISRSEDEQVKISNISSLQESMGKAQNAIFTLFSHASKTLSTKSIDKLPMLDDLNVQQNMFEQSIKKVNVNFPDLIQSEGLVNKFNENLQVSTNIHEQQTKQLNQISLFNGKLVEFRNSQKDLQNSISRLSGVFTLSSKRNERKIKNILKVENLNNNSVKINELIKHNTQNIDSDSLKAKTSINKLRFAVSRLGGLVWEASAAAKSDTVTSIQANQAKQLIDEINLHFVTINRFSDIKNKYQSDFNDLKQNFDKFINIGFYGSDSVLSLRKRILDLNDVLGEMLNNVNLAGGQLNSQLTYSLKKANNLKETVVLNADLAAKKSKMLLILASVIIILFILIVSLFVVRLILGSLTSLSKALANIAEGDADLTVRLDKAKLNELSIIEALFNRFIQRIENVIVDVFAMTNHLENAAKKLTKESRNTRDLMSHQDIEIKQVSSSMKQMLDVVNNVKTNIESSNQVAVEAKENSKSSSQELDTVVAHIKHLDQVMSNTDQVMNELKKRSESINSVLSVISEIAEQTNLLALNAAIESARAGEHGRGFAVVADEVRGLAARTQESTQKISVIIDDLQQGTLNAATEIATAVDMANKVNSLVGQANTAVHQGVESLTKIVERSTNIASAVEQQVNSSQSVQDNVISMESNTMYSLQSSNNVDELSDNLNSISKQLRKLIVQFQFSKTS